MKKLLGIIVLGLLLSGNAYADIQSTLIDRHLSNKKLDLIEGVWFIGKSNNVIWKDVPMCRYVGQNDDEQCSPWKSLDDYVSTK